MKRPLLKLLHRRIAGISVSASTARGMGPKGTVAAARFFLMQIDLHRFRTSSRRAFIEELDRQTIRLKKALPRGARNWGPARKFLNIFLRNVTYNRWLCVTFRLRRIERWLEVPLDSHVALALRKESGGALPRWKTVIGLTPERSALYQAFAESLARSRAFSRVHLDLVYWRNP